MVHSAMVASFRQSDCNENARGSAQPFERLGFVEGKTLDFASPGLDFPSQRLGFFFPEAWIFLPKIWIFLPLLAQTESSAAPTELDEQ
jgi:hypothetical protein